MVLQASNKLFGKFNPEAVGAVGIILISAQKLTNESIDQQYNYTAPKREEQSCTNHAKFQATYLTNISPTDQKVRLVTFILPSRCDLLGSLDFSMIVRKELQL